MGNPDVKPYRQALPAEAIALLEEAMDFERDSKKGKDGMAF